MRTLEILHDEYRSCTKCDLSKTRTNVVFGYGNPHAQFLVVGEGPGEVEDLSGFPFVGPSGNWLDYFLASTSENKELQKMMIAKEKDPKKYDYHRVRELLLEEFFFTNVVCCRPPGNRDPANIEIDACKNRLEETILLVDPVIIITAGKTSLEALLGKKVKSILAKRGEMYEMKLNGRFVPVTYPIISILHPSFLMRSAGDDAGGYSTRTYNDVLKARYIVDEFNFLHYGIDPPKNRPKYIIIGESHGNQESN